MRAVPSFFLSWDSGEYPRGDEGRVKRKVERGEKKGGKGGEKREEKMERMMKKEGINK